MPVTLFPIAMIILVTTTVLVMSVVPKVIAARSSRSSDRSGSGYR